MFGIQWPFIDPPTHVWDDRSHPCYQDHYGYVVDAREKRLVSVLQMNERTGCYLRFSPTEKMLIAGAAEAPLRFYPSEKRE